MVRRLPEKAIHRYQPIPEGARISSRGADGARENQSHRPADVVVIPAGTGHWFAKIDDHISYLMVRIDPDKVTPLKGESQSRDYLSKPARK